MNLFVTERSFGTERTLCYSFSWAALAFFLCVCVGDTQPNSDKKAAKGKKRS